MSISKSTEQFIFPKMLQMTQNISKCIENMILKALESLCLLRLKAQRKTSTVIGKIYWLV